MFDIDDPNQEKKVTQYLIPANVSTKFEIFEGFGWNEARIVIFALLIGFALYLITGLFTYTVQYKKSELPYTETIGLENKKNVITDGDNVTERKDVIPQAVRFFFIILPAAGAYFVVKRDPSTGMSLISMIQASREFSKKQKRYLYKYDSGMEV
jgi:hypothetical protein